MENIKQQIEEWKDIEGYEGKYQISNFGNVKSLKRKRYDINYIVSEKILRPNISKVGYFFVGLCKNSVSKTRYIHKLVAQHFIGDGGNLFVDHIDMDSKNNNVENLRYVTNSENQHNTLKRKTPSTSKYKGVCFDRERGLYVASIRCKDTRKLKKLGRFRTQEEAALKVNEYVIENDYKHYRLNIIN